MVIAAMILAGGWTAWQWSRFSAPIEEADFYGGDIPSLDSGMQYVKYSDCKMRCIFSQQLYQNKCIGFTYLRYKGVPDVNDAKYGRCFLKNKMDYYQEKRSNANYFTHPFTGKQTSQFVSQIKGDEVKPESDPFCLELYERYEPESPPILVQGNKNFEDCRKECLSNPACLSFAFTKTLTRDGTSNPMRNSCRHYAVKPRPGDDTDRVDDHGAISGTRYPYDEHARCRKLESRVATRSNN